jgi:short-subunit dehydrogenase
MSDNILILGASSGVARALSELLAADGHSLLLAGHDADDLRRTAADLGVRFGHQPPTLEFEACDFAHHAEFFAQCVACFNGHLDGLVLCHGWLVPQAQTDRDVELARRVIDVNYTSAVSVLNLAAAYMQQRHRGYLCVLTSVAGDRCRPSNYLYGSTKAALTGFLQGLRARLSHSGVSVTTVIPGLIDTPMTWGLPNPMPPADPRWVARDIRRAMRRRRNVIYTPWFWRPIMGIVKIIPEPIFKRMKW